MYTYMVILLYYRQLEITDNIIQMFIKLIKRVENKAEKELQKTIIRDIKKD